MDDRAAEDLKILLDRGYRKDSALRFVGEHYELGKKDRNQLMQAIFSEDEIRFVKSRVYPVGAVEGKPLVIDGFNVLITLETALTGGEVYKCMDGILRDNLMAFSSYRIKNTTHEAADRIIELLKTHPPSQTTWILDSQISGSGRLAEYIRRAMIDAGLEERTTTSPNADHRIIKMNVFTATSDSGIIRKVGRVVDLPSAVTDL